MKSNNNRCNNYRNKHPVSVRNSVFHPCTPFYSSVHTVTNWSLPEYQIHMMEESKGLSLALRQAIVIFRRNGGQFLYAIFVVGVGFSRQPLAL